LAITPGCVEVPLSSADIGSKALAG
jgi:hypothetical protein